MVSTLNRRERWIAFGKDTILSDATTETVATPVEGR